MTENKVTLDLKKYDELKEFERAVKETKLIFYNYYTEEFRCIEPNEVIEKLNDRKDQLIKEINLLKNPKNEEITLDDVKKMSLFSLVKWKLRRKK